MIHIQTRQKKDGTWWCNGTISGYDHSFGGVSISAAQYQMILFLNKQNIRSEDVKWQEPQLYDKNGDLHEYLIQAQTTRLS